MRETQAYSFGEINVIPGTGAAVVVVEVVVAVIGIVGVVIEFTGRAVLPASTRVETRK